MKVQVWKSAVVGVLTLALAACSGGGASPSASTAAPTDAASTAPESTAPESPAATDASGGKIEVVVPIGETKGPAGESATPAAEVKLTPEEIEKVKAGGYKAALLWHQSSDFVNAVTRGAEDAFKDLGIDIVATTDAGFDSAKQASDVETTLALKPDIMLTLVIDPVSGAEAFRPAIRAGTKLVLLSNVPKGYVHGTDYVGLVTDDLFGMGQGAAELLAQAMGEQGEVGYVFHDASYYVTNQRDQAFKKVIADKYPNMQIVAEQGITDPARAEEIASAMLIQHPNIKGIYVTWDTPAEGVIAALRAAGRDDVKVVTLDFGANNAVDLAQGGNLVGVTADLAYQLGYTMAVVGAYGILGKLAPAFTIVPAIKATKDNLVESWRESLGQDPPAQVLEALGQ